MSLDSNIPSTPNKQKINIGMVISSLLLAASTVFQPNISEAKQPSRKEPVTKVEQKHLGKNIETDAIDMYPDIDAKQVRIEAVKFNIGDTIKYKGKGYYAKEVKDLKITDVAKIAFDNGQWNNSQKLGMINRMLKENRNATYIALTLDTGYNVIISLHGEDLSTYINEDYMALVTQASVITTDDGLIQVTDDQIIHRLPPGTNLFDQK